MSIPLAPPSLEPNRSSRSAVRRVRTFVFSPWADRLRDGAEYLRELPGFDVSARVSNPRDPSLLNMARLDCDWHGENVRAFGSMTADEIEFLPVQALGKYGLADLMSSPMPEDEEWWLIVTGQHPQFLAGMIGKLLAVLSKRGIRTLYYAFDEVSRTMPACLEIAPYLSVFIHDEFPLAEPIRAALSPQCRVVHRSWVANLVPFASPFVEEPEEKIIFLGSKLGLTPHRQRQLDFLSETFRDKFTAICDHSLSVAGRASLSRFKVGLCPEGRKFTAPTMSATHTDRPFWAGALGMIPVSEDSQQGGRLEDLHQAGLIFRYAHGDLKALRETCERALATPGEHRRKIYQHFNQHEVVGAVVAKVLSALP